MYTLVFANGDLNDGPAVRLACVHAVPRFVIAADGGLRHVIALGLQPDLVIGDMDSADPVALAQVQARGARVQRFPADKDETDLELALDAAVLNSTDSIYIFGATGDRLDQTLGNVYLLMMSILRNRDVRLISGRQTAWLAYPGETVIEGQPGDTLSLIPLKSEAKGIVTHQLKYPLDNESLPYGAARGMSNVLLANTARVSFENGVLLMIHTIGRA